MKLKGLGRGLDALLAANQENARIAEALRNLKVSLLQPGKYQPRTRMDKESLAELAESIKSQGVMQPILVRPVARRTLRNHRRRAALARSATCRTRGSAGARPRGAG